MKRCTPTTRLTSTTSQASTAPHVRHTPRRPCEWIVGDAAGDVVDVGAGTGLFTRLLLDDARTVIAVEPSSPMLDELRTAAARSASPCRGSGERMPLPDASADVVIFAQAWHWVDVPAASGRGRPRAATGWSARSRLEPPRRARRLGARARCGDARRRRPLPRRGRTIRTSRRRSARPSGTSSSGCAVHAGRDRSPTCARAATSRCSPRQTRRTFSRPCARCSTAPDAGATRSSSRT